MRFSGVFAMARGVVLGAAFVGAAAAACRTAEAQVAVTVQATETDAAQNKWEVTVNVTGLVPGDKWKDIHLHALSGFKFPKLDSGDGPIAVGTQDWKCKGGGTGTISVYADGAEGHGNGTFKFTLDFNNQDKGFKNRSTGWACTRNGKRKYDPTDVIAESGEVVPTMPQALCEWPDPEEEIATGATKFLTFATESGFAGMRYVAYTSLSTSPWHEDALGIGIHSETDPVPAEWGLTFSNFAGEIDAQGAPTRALEIACPANPALVGKTFYVVYVVSWNASGEDWLVVSSPLRVTIVAP